MYAKKRNLCFVASCMWILALNNVETTWLFSQIRCQKMIRSNDQKRDSWNCIFSSLRTIQSALSQVFPCTKPMFLSFPVYSELQDNWIQGREPVLDGVTFCVKFLGSTLIDKTGASDAAEATKTVIQMVRLTFGYHSWFTQFSHYLYERVVGRIEELQFRVNEKWQRYFTFQVKAGQKTNRVGLKVSTTGITLIEPNTGETRLEISIYE